MSDDIAFARPFVLQRDRDLSDVSGTGIVADGVLFPDGHAAIHWRGKWPLTTPHPDGMDSIIAIHDHGGRGDLHVIWTEEETARRIKFLTDIAAAFEVPAAVLGTEAERAGLNQQIEALLRAAAFREQARYRPIREAVRVPEAIEVTGHLDRFAEAVMPVIDQLLAARDRAQKTAGRGYLLADRWEAAHGSANFLVRAAGVELREALDSARDDPDDMAFVRQHYPSPASEPRWCGSRARHDAHNWVDYATPRHCPGHDPADQDPPDQGPLTGIEVRDPCPYCEGCPLVPRALMDDHVRVLHPEVHTVESGTPVPPSEGAVCEEHGVTEWACVTRPQTGEIVHFKRARPGLRFDFTGSSLHGAEDPLKPDTPADNSGPVPPADDDVARARTVLLARFGADQADVVDRLIRAVERRSCCDLPHEMEV